MLDLAGSRPGIARPRRRRGGRGAELRRRSPRRPRTVRCSRPTSPRISSGTSQQDAAAAGLPQVSRRGRGRRGAARCRQSGFDAVICRLGLIYLPDRGRAPEGNACSAAPRRPHRRGGVLHGGGEPVLLGARSPSSGPPRSCRRRCPANPGRSASVPPRSSTETLTAAGFVDIDVRRVGAPLRLSSAAECVRFERESFGALHQMLAGLDPDAQDRGLARHRRARSARSTGRTGSSARASCSSSAQASPTGQVEAARRSPARSPRTSDDGRRRPWGMQRAPAHAGALSSGRVRRQGLEPRTR